MQVKGNYAEKDFDKNNNKSSMKNTFSLILLKEGFRGFFKGITINFFKGPFANGVAFYSKHIIESYIFSVNHR